MKKVEVFWTTVYGC